MIEPLPPAEAKRRFMLYFGIKLVAIAGMVGAALLFRADQPVLAGIASLIAVAAILVRPRHIFPDMRQ